MAGDSYTRLAMLRYLETNSAVLLRNVLDHDPGVDKDVEVRLCQMFEDHDRHARELNAMLRDSGHQGEAVPPSFETSVERRISDIGRAHDKAEVVEALAGLERYAVEQYEIAISQAPASLQDALESHIQDERGHTHFLAAKARDMGAS